MARVRNMKRRTHRKGTRRSKSRSMRGGYMLSGSDIDNSSMNSSTKLSMLQGKEYASQHANQHGGVSNIGYTGALPQDMRQAARVDQAGGMAPVGDTGVMDVGRVEARLGPLDASFQEIAGMKDQAGGRRRRRKNSRRKNSRRMSSRKSSRKSRRCWSRKSRRNMRGGVASVENSTTLLPVDMEKQAVMGMNPEWKLAENPTSFNPSQ